MVAGNDSVAIALIVICCICILVVTALSYAFPLYVKYVKPYKEYAPASTYVSPELLKNARKWGICLLELVPPGLDSRKCKMVCLQDNGGEPLVLTQFVTNATLMRIELTDEGVKVFAYLHPMTVSQGIAFKKAIIDHITYAINVCARRKEDEEFQATGKLPYVPNMD